MSSTLSRRHFLVRTWRAGIGLIGAAGMLSMWKLLQPLATSGFGGKVRTISPRAVKDGTVKEVPAARGYLVKPVGGELIALSQKCPHLGCKVSWCDSSQKFECPCHGSKFNIVGEKLEGPTPRGLDSYPIEIGSDKLVYVDTSSKKNGPAPGTITVDTPTGGASCSGGKA